MDRFGEGGVIYFPFPVPKIHPWNWHVHISMAYGKSKLINKPIYCTVTSFVCVFTHRTVFHQYACAKIWNGSNLRAIATYRANLDLVLTKPSVVSNSCISLASKLPRQFFKKGVLLDHAAVEVWTCEVSFLRLRPVWGATPLMNISWLWITIFDCEYQCICLTKPTSETQRGAV